VQPLAYLPSPSQSVWHLGPVPVRAYALCIVLGIFVSIAVATRRMRERGGRSEDIWDVAGWAIVFGVIGGRLYNVVSDPELYFEGRPGTSPIDAFKVWDGGLGIWGAIALGFFGAWIGCRRHGIALLGFADVVIPGIVFAQGIGRWGNWFNNELYGGPTSLPWGLQIHCLNVTVGHAVAGGTASGGEQCAANSSVLAEHYQPTFLYESIWDIALGFALLAIDRRKRLGRGNVMALYAMGYTMGRIWIEALRSDHANHILGLRLNIWTCIIVFALALVWFLRHEGFRSVREASPYTAARQAREAAEAARAATVEARPVGAHHAETADPDETADEPLAADPSGTDPPAAPDEPPAADPSRAADDAVRVDEVEVDGRTD
jgi:prolipoprotein diacylglyceryl transferase